MLRLLSLLFFHLIKFVNNILVLIWRILISSYESVRDAAVTLYNYKIEIGIILGLFFFTLPISLFQSEVQTGADIVYECGFTYVFQTLQSFLHKFVRDIQTWFAYGYDDLVMYLKDSVIDTYHELLAIHDVLSIEGIFEIFSILYDEFKTVAMSFFDRPSLQIPYFSPIILSLEKIVFCFSDVGGEVIESIVEGTIASQHCDICMLDPDGQCPISAGATIFGLPSAVFPSRNCSDCRDPVGESFKCIALFVNTASSNAISLQVNGITESISCIINQIIIPPIYFIQALIFNCLTSSISYVLQVWFTSIVDCFNSFIYAVTNGQADSFWDLFFKYVFPLIQAVIDGFNGLIACEKDPDFKNCLSSWPSSPSSCTGTVCGSCIMNSDGSIQRGISTCFRRNAMCIISVPFFNSAPLPTLINLIPNVIGIIDYIVCPFEISAECFSSSYATANHFSTEQFSRISDEFYCIKQRVPIFSFIGGLLSDIFSAIGSFVDFVNSKINEIEGAIDTLANAVTNAGDEIKNFFDSFRKRFDEEKTEKLSSELIKIFDSLNQSRSLNRSHSFYNFSTNDKYELSYLGKLYFNYNDKLLQYKIDALQGKRGPMIMEAFKPVYDPFINSTYFKIMNSFYDKYTLWSNENGMHHKFQIISNDELNGEHIKKRTRQLRMEKIYIDHVNAFILQYQKDSSEIRQRQNEIRKKLNIPIRIETVSSSIAIQEQNFAPMTIKRLYEKDPFIEKISYQITNETSVLNRLLNKSLIFYKVWKVFDKHFDIELNPIIQRTHMIFSVIKHGQTREFVKWVKGENEYLIKEGFVNKRMYNKAMKRREREYNGPIMTFINGKSFKRDQQISMEMGPFLSRKAGFNRTEFVMKSIYEEMMRAHIQKTGVQTTGYERFSDKRDTLNPIVLKRLESRALSSTDYNEKIYAFFDSIISWIKGPGSQPFKNAVNNIKSSFDNYDYKGFLQHNVLDNLIRFTTVHFPEDINGTNQYNPFAFPLIPYDMFSVIQLEPNSNIPLQIPWPQEFITTDCVKVFNGDSDLFHFSYSDNCETNNGKYCPDCDYCQRDYGIECKDLGFRDALDSGLFILAAIPRVIETVYVGGIDIKELTPWVITAELIFLVTTGPLVFIFWAFTYIALYTISFIFGGIIPYGLLLFIIIVVLLFVLSQLQTFFKVAISISILFAFTWVISLFFTFPNLALYISFNSWFLSGIGVWEKYFGFFGSNQDLKNRLQTFNYDPHSDIPFIDKYCFFMTISNIFLGICYSIVIAIMTSVAISVGFAIILFIAAEIEQLILFINDIINYRARNRQDDLRVWKAETSGKLHRISSAFKSGYTRMQGKFIKTHSSDVESPLIEGNINSKSVEIPLAGITKREKRENKEKIRKKKVYSS